MPEPHSLSSRDNHNTGEFGLASKDLDGTPNNTMTIYNIQASFPKSCTHGYWIILDCNPV